MEFVWDPRRLLHVYPTEEDVLEALCRAFISLATSTIEKEGSFLWGLSGGRTPQELYQRLSQPSLQSALDWSKVFLVWGDERSVPPEDPASNYGEAMRSGLKQLPIPESHVFRMQAEELIDLHAEAYEKILIHSLPKKKIDLLLLGIGEDGHTLSLFPETKALEETQRFCVANWVPRLETWRMTLTFPALENCHHLWMLALGAKKAPIVGEVMEDLAGVYPASQVGTSKRPVEWWMDRSAASLLPLRE